MLRTLKGHFHGSGCWIDSPPWPVYIILQKVWWQRPIDASCMFTSWTMLPQRGSSAEECKVNSRRDSRWKWGSFQSKQNLSESYAVHFSLAEANIPEINNSMSLANEEGQRRTNNNNTREPCNLCGEKKEGRGEGTVHWICQRIPPGNTLPPTSVETEQKNQSVRRIKPPRSTRRAFIFNEV